MSTTRRSFLKYFGIVPAIPVLAALPALPVVAEPEVLQDSSGVWVALWEKDHPATICSGISEALWRRLYSIGRSSGKTDMNRAWLEYRLTKGLPI